MPRRPWIDDQRTAKWIGVVLLAAALLVLYDAYERRGARTPMLLRPILPF